MIPGVLVKVYGVRSEPFILSCSTCQGSLFLPLLYMLVLEPFFHKVKLNPVLYGITLPGATISARYSAYVNNISVFVMSRGYKIVTRAKINCDKPAGLQLCTWRRVSHP